MVNYNYVHISINFKLLLQLLVDRSIIQTADHFNVFFNFVLANFINQIARLIHLQVTIFISLMSWNRRYITIDARGYPKISYSIEF